MKIKMTILSALLALNVVAGGLECAIDVLLSEKAASQDLVINKQSFTAYPVEVKKEGKGHVINGRLVYHGAAKQNQEVLYRIDKTGGAVKNIELNFGNGWEAIAPEFMTALGGFARGEPMPEERQLQVARNLEKAANGAWQKAASFLAAKIAYKHC